MRRWRTLTIAAAALFASAAPVHAEEGDGPPCSGFGGGCSRIVEERVESFVHSPGTVSEYVEYARANPTRACTIGPVPTDFDPRVDIYASQTVPARAIYYVRSCDGLDAFRWYLPSSAETNDENVIALVGEAFDVVAPPAPSVVTSPPAGTAVLTGLPMYLAVDEVAFAEHSGTVSAGQFTVTAVARPLETQFLPGDDSDPVTCGGRGTLWQHGDRPTDADCTHTFTRTPAALQRDSDSFQVATQVRYAASYTVEGPLLAGTYELGTFEGPETLLSVPVTERRAVRVAGG